MTRGAEGKSNTPQLIPFSAECSGRLNRSSFYLTGGTRPRSARPELARRAGGFDFHVDAKVRETETRQTSSPSPR